MKRLAPACPASTIIDGPPIGGPSSICGVLARDRDEEGPGVAETDDWHVFTTREDPGTVLRFCCSGYVDCVIWQAERDRIDAVRKGLSMAGAPPSPYESILREG